MSATATREWFSSRILKWYALHGRHDLPWKHPVSAYRVWVSEIMLQQTQVVTVIPYFLNFMETFPTVAALAEAPINLVLNHWAGLGYYARAKNLHRAAQTIMTDFKGRFPKTVDQWTSLPGVGRSTAGAIISQSFDIRAPILDGNVKRVLCRFNGITGWPGQKTVEQILWDASEHYTPDDNAADYTQAMMDLGATCCTRSRPQCQVCPLKTKCHAYANDSQSTLPEKRPSKTLPTKTTHILVLQTDCGHLLLEQRPLKGIWPGLWIFPEFSDLKAMKTFLSGTVGLKQTKLDTLSLIKHTFSHYHLHLKPSYLAIAKKRPLKMDGTLEWINATGLKERGVPAPIKTLIRKLGVLS